MFASNKIIISTIFAISFAAVAQSQVLFLGPCAHNVSVQNDFDVSKYLGIWYEHSKYPAIFEVGGKCNVANYTLRPDGDVNVINTMINKDTNDIEDIEGFARVISDAKLMVTFPVLPHLKVSANYWVLGTDYDTYSVVYSCNPVGRFNLQHSIIAWILTRDRQASAATIKEAESVLTANGIPTDFLIKTSQIGCSAEDIPPTTN